MSRTSSDIAAVASPSDSPDGSRIVRITFFVEGLFALFGLLGIVLLNLDVPLAVSPTNTVLGILFAIVLFLASCAFLLQPVRNQQKLHQVYEFNARFVLPFASRLNFRQAALVSVFAGVGEEIFFRGLLQPLMGIGLSGAAFSLLHFGTHWKRYPVVLLLYFLISCAFGFVFEASGSLWSVIVAHAVYDLVILTFVRRFPVSFSVR